MVIIYSKLLQITNQSGRSPYLKKFIQYLLIKYMQRAVPVGYKYCFCLKIDQPEIKNITSLPIHGIGLPSSNWPWYIAYWCHPAQYLKYLSPVILQSIVSTHKDTW